MKVSFLLLALFVALVFSSKQLIIYNEEILVAVCFVGFVLFVQTSFGETIRSTFTERQTSLLSDLHHYLSSREAYLIESIKHHQLRSTSLRSSTQMIGEACLHTMITRCGPQCLQTVQAVLSQQVVGQLKTFLAVQNQSRESFQNQIVARFRSTVCNQFRFAQLRKHQSKLVRQSILLLKERKSVVQQRNVKKGTSL